MQVELCGLRFAACGLQPDTAIFLRDTQNLQNLQNLHNLHNLYAFKPSTAIRASPAFVDSKVSPWPIHTRAYASTTLMTGKYHLPET